MAGGGGVVLCSLSDKLCHRVGKQCRSNMHKIISIESPPPVTPQDNFCHTAHHPKALCGRQRAELDEIEDVYTR